MPAKKLPAEFLFGPTPHAEAVAFLESRPVVSREAFKQLLPELKGRAFTISGIEDANLMARIRERLADPPRGESWDTIKRDIADNLHPYLGDPDDPENTIAAERRAELLLRTHGFQAYQAAAYEVGERQKDVFPYLQYVTMGDGKVRDTHRALDGVVLPRDHEFWRTHMPPWDWGCRCQAIPLSEDDYGDKLAADEGKPKDQREVLDSFAQQDLTKTRRLVRNGVAYNLAAPSETGKEGAFQWHPSDLRLPLADLRKRYDTLTWSAFEAFARGQKMEGGQTVWDWLETKAA